MKTTVLFVEDNPALRYCVRRLLESEDYLVLEASDGEEAIRMLDAVPDCVLLDLMLPVVSGAGVFRYIREWKIATRVVIITALDCGIVYDMAMELKPDAVLKKPADMAAIVAAIGPVRRNGTGS